MTLWALRRVYSTVSLNAPQALHLNTRFWTYDVFKPSRSGAPHAPHSIVTFPDPRIATQRCLSLGLPRPGLVVSNKIGEPFQPATFSGAWKDFAEAHGFGGITFHGLQHGAATLLLAAGVPDTVAMRAMGHADTRILARYQDVVTELQQDAAARMDRLLGG